MFYFLDLNLIFAFGKRPRWPSPMGRSYSLLHAIAVYRLQKRIRWEAELAVLLAIFRLKYV